MYLYTSLHYGSRVFNRKKKTVYTWRERKDNRIDIFPGQTFCFSNMCCFFFWQRAQTFKLKSVKEKETQVQPCTQLPQRHLTFTKACTAVLKKVLQTKQCRSLTPQCWTRLELLPSPAARLDVDGLVGGEGRAVGAGMAVTGYPLQRQVLRVHRQTHPARQRHTHAQHSRRGEWTDGRAEGVREEEAG